jgi:hypothetical protein
MPFVAIKMGRRLGKRVVGSAYRRIGVWGSKTAFRHGYNDQEVLTELMMLCKRRHADKPMRPYVSPSRPIFIATLRAAASSLFFCVARSLRINLHMLVVTAGPARTALKNSQLTCGERHAISGTGH